MKPLKLLRLSTSAILLCMARPGLSQAEDRGCVGVIFARNTAELAAKVPATVRDVRVRLGDSVHEGQVLLVLESPGLAQELAGAQAALWAARADSNRAAAEQRQLAGLLARRGKASDVFTKDEIESLELRETSAEATLESARATVSQRTATLQALEERKHALSLRAPFSGKIAFCASNPGEFVTVGQPLVRLASTDDLWVRFAVPSSEAAAWLAVGRTVEIQLDAAPARLHAEVRQVSPEIDSVTGMIFAEAAMLLGDTSRTRPPLGAVVHVAPVAP